MEKVIEVEGISYTLRTRTVREGKELRNRLKVDGFKSGNEAALGDFEVFTVMASLKAWSRPEPLTLENFEKLTPDTHLGRLFEAAQEVNTLGEELKNGSSGQS